MIQWIDIHCHFDMLEGSPDAIVQLAEGAQVNKMITIGTEPSDHKFVIEVAEKLYPKVFCTLGVHPHQGVQWQEATAEFLMAEHSRREVVAIGEIGLDYYYNQSGKAEQLTAFRRQMQVAKACGLPVQIHTRDADQDTAEILKEFKGDVRGIIHCFTSSPELARLALDLGYNISFSGIVTFKNAQTLRDLCKTIPIDRMHVETDSPFLAPVPMRGKKNTPAFVVHTGKFIAELLQVDLQIFADQMWKNAHTMFTKLSQ